MQYRTPEDWKSEAQARRWAHMRLLSIDAIKTAAMQSAGDIYDIADALDVTVSFLREAIEDYQAKGLWNFSM